MFFFLSFFQVSFSREVELFTHIESSALSKSIKITSFSVLSRFQQKFNLFKWKKKNRYDVTMKEKIKLKKKPKSMRCDRDNFKYIRRNNVWNLFFVCYHPTQAEQNKKYNSIFISNFCHTSHEMLLVLIYCFVFLLFVSLKSWAVFRFEKFQYRIQRPFQKNIKRR